MWIIIGLISRVNAWFTQLVTLRTENSKARLSSSQLNFEYSNWSMNFYHLATLVNWFHSISDMLSLRRTVILFISRLILVKLSSPTCSYDRTENQTTTKSKNVLRQWRKFFARALSKFSFVIRERNFAFSFMISLRLSQTLNGWCSRGFLLGERGWMFVSSFANIFTYIFSFI